MRSWNGFHGAAWLVALACLSFSFAADAQDAEDHSERFAVGFAKRDITPQKPMPMWGYGARHAMLSNGTLTPLWAKAVVIHAGEGKLAIVGLDLGRGPTRVMTERIRREIAQKAGIEHVLMSGSHTHHGPCLELIDREGCGKGTFDDAIAYNEKLPELLIEAILDADAQAKPARLAVAAKDVPFNRNRHTKREPRALDPMLAAIRFDDEAGQPIAVVVNFAAHPVMTKEDLLKFSADYPGFLQDKVEADLQTNCVFMQGASGDLSPNPPGDFRNPQAFGELLAEHVLELVKSVETKKPARPSVQGKVDRYRFASRMDFANPVTVATYEVAFFPELIRSFIVEMQDGIGAECTTVLLNRDLALVGGSGEFFCNHSRRLKERSYVGTTLFFGYCNDHSLYFPTIEAVSEGGYGADAPVSPVAIGAGEQMLNQALIHIYEMAGKIPKQSSRAE
jgi:neutral ceramidase